MYKVKGTSMVTRTQFAEEGTIFSGNIPCRVYLCLLRPLGQKRTEVLASSVSGEYRKVGEISLTLPIQVIGTLLGIGYSDVSSYRDSYQVVSVGVYDPEHAVRDWKETQNRKRAAHENWDTIATQGYDQV